MKKENRRIAIAEFCGWTEIQICPTLNGRILVGNHPNLQEDERNFPLKSGEYGAPVPDYADCLNAIHEAEKHLTEDQLGTYDGWLIMCADDFSSRRATAEQRVESLLRTIGKWEEFD